MPINIRLKAAIEEYCEHLEARGLAKGTVRSRRFSLLALPKHAGNIYVGTVTHRHIDQVFSAEPWSESTRNLKLGQFKQFFQWCRSRRYMGRDDDPMFGWRMLPVPTRTRTRIPVQEWSRLFEACIHPTEEIALATGLYLFLRGSEQQHIQMKHIRLDESIIEVWRQKTREWDEMPISSELDHHLRKYLTWYAKQVAVQPDHYLLPPRRLGSLVHDPVTHRLVAGTGQINPDRPHTKPHLIVQRILERAGYPTEWEGEHTLRRSGARAYFDTLAEAGYDGALRRVQAMLGHRNSLVTETYLGLDLDRRQRNADIAGQPMFPQLQDDNVVDLPDSRERGA